MSTMDWMYKGVSGLVDKEEYLTGRRIDKTFEIINKSETQSKGDLDAFEPSIPGSVFDSNQTNQSLVTIDLVTKLREDPLYEIRVKEREQRSKLLNNPLKLKKLKSILESTMAEDKHNKHKKKKSRKRSHSRDSNSDDDYKSDRKKHRKEYKSDRQLDHRRDERRHKYDSNRDRNRNRDERDVDRRYDHKLKELKSDSKSDRRIEKRFHSKQSNDLKPKKLSAQELEQKRKEMIENAVWRECQRKSNVKTFEDEEKAENKFNSSSSSAQFIKPLLKSAAESDSLEDRIRQKRFRAQKGFDVMDKNFAKK